MNFSVEIRKTEVEWLILPKLHRRLHRIKFGAFILVQCKIGSISEHIHTSTNLIAFATKQAKGTNNMRSKLCMIIQSYNVFHFKIKRNIFFHLFSHLTIMIRFDLNRFETYSHDWVRQRSCLCNNNNANIHVRWYVHGSLGIQRCIFVFLFSPASQSSIVHIHFRSLFRFRIEGFLKMIYFASCKFVRCGLGVFVCASLSAMASNSFRMFSILTACLFLLKIPFW